MGDVRKTARGAALLEEIRALTRKGRGDVAHNITIPESIQRMMDRTSVESMLKQAGKVITPAMVKELNHALNQIPKPVEGETD